MNMKLDNLNFDDIVVPKASSKRDKIDSLMLQGIINMINNAKAEGCYSVKRKDSCSRER